MTLAENTSVPDIGETLVGQGADMVAGAEAAASAGRGFLNSLRNGRLAFEDSDVVSAAAHEMARNPYAALSSVAQAAEMPQVDSRQFYDGVMRSFFNQKLLSDFQVDEADIDKAWTQKQDLRLARMSKFCPGGFEEFSDALTDFDGARVRKFTEDYVYS